MFHFSLRKIFFARFSIIETPFFSFIFSNWVSFWKNHSSNFRYIYSEIAIGMIVRWANNKRLSLKYYGTSKRQKRSDRENVTRRRCEKWKIHGNPHSRLANFSEHTSKCSPLLSSPFNARHDNFPRYRLVVSVIMTHIFQATCRENLWALVPMRLLGW